MSCINEIKFDDDELSNEMVVNCLVSPDSIVKANFTYSRFFLDPSGDFVTIKDLDVKLYINAALKETLKLKGSNYVSSYRTKSGDNVKITARHISSSQITSAETYVPFTVKINGIDSSRVYNFDSYLTHDTIVNQNTPRTDTLGLIRNFKYTFNVKLTDFAETTDFYRIAATIRQTYADGKSASKRIVLYPDDEVFDRVDGAEVFDANSDRNFNIFSDSTFKGQSYNLKTSAKITQLLPTPAKTKYPPANQVKIPVKTELIFDLQAIDKGFFRYLKTVKYNNTDLQYFSEPVQIYNNVENGIGLLGSVTHSYYNFVFQASVNGYYYY